MVAENQNLGNVHKDGADRRRETEEKVGEAWAYLRLEEGEMVAAGRRAGLFQCLVVFLTSI